ncbi:MAG: hypothetical protein AAGH70_09225 [Pseudomonadota bacterium]
MDANLLSLRDLAPLKTWSLLMTILGDCEATPAEPVRSGVLRDLLGELGVTPEAARVSLHRLRKDGWVDAQKRGRESDYYLTEKGLSETRAVRRRVYAADLPELETWTLHAVETVQHLPQTPHVVLSPHLVALPLGTVMPDSFILAPAHVAPSWVHRRCLPQDLRALAEGLIRQAAPETAAERILILHHWRRLSLRDGFWLSRALDPGGQADRCRVAALAAIGVRSL